MRIGKKKDIGFFLRYSRVLQPSGEQFEVNTNLPSTATKGDFEKAFELMSVYPEKRMATINAAVQKLDAQEQKDTPLNREQRRNLKDSAKAN